tara:strand:- start:385 stop:495 length:111 start_codon:yes stop_codon:yes gene_type:complete
MTEFSEKEMQTLIRQSINRVLEFEDDKIDTAELNGW